MKRQIDPNLHSNDSESLLYGNSLENENAKKKFDVEKQIEKAEKEIEEILSSDEFTDSKIVEIENQNEHHHSSSHHHSGKHHHSSGHHSSGNHHSSSHHHSGSHHHSSEHHHSSSKKHHRKSSKKKKMPTWVKVIISIILILSLIIGGLGTTYAVLLNKGKDDLTSIANASDEYKETISYNGHMYQYNSNLITIAFMGIDERDYVERDDLNLGCADADMVAVIDTFTGTMKLISLPRDTMVDIDIYSDSGLFLKTKNVQLTLSYSYGDGGEQSCKNVTKAMSRILYGVPIDKYFALNLEGIAPLNDAVGGVTIDSLYDIPYAGIKKGERVTLKGDMAEAYVRTRDMDRATAAIERGDRQIQYVKAYANQILPAVKKDFNIVTELYNTATKYSQTNITLNNATYLAQLMLSKNITTFDSYNLKGEVTLHPLETNPEIINAQFVPDEKELMELVLEVFYTQID